MVWNSNVEFLKICFLKAESGPEIRLGAHSWTPWRISLGSPSWIAKLDRRKLMSSGAQFVAHIAACRGKTLRATRSIKLINPVSWPKLQKFAFRFPLAQAFGRFFQERKYFNLTLMMCFLLKTRKREFYWRGKIYSLEDLLENPFDRAHQSAPECTGMH